MNSAGCTQSVTLNAKERQDDDSSYMDNSPTRRFLSPARLELGKDKGKEQGYFDGYKKGFSDAKFLSKMEHERQHQLETMINKNIFIKCGVCLKRHGKHKTTKQ